MGGGALEGRGRGWEGMEEREEGVREDYGFVIFVPRVLCTCLTAIAVGVSALYLFFLRLNRLID